MDCDIQSIPSVLKRHDQYVIRRSSAGTMAAGNVGAISRLFLPLFQVAGRVAWWELLDVRDFAVLSAFPHVHPARDSRHKSRSQATTIAIKPLREVCL